VTNQDTAVTIDVLANDTDVDGDALSVVSVTESRNGTIVINADNTITYTPTGDYFGVDSFQYMIDDGQDGQATAEVTITVNANSLGLVNGGFEEDLLGWEAIGDASSQTSDIGESPVAGQKQGMISTSNTLGGNIVVANLETFLGLAAGDINDVTVGTATAGSAMRQVISVSAGMQLTFSYNFLTNEATPDSNYNDFAFFSVVGPGVQQASLLADTYDGGFAASASVYKESTGYLTFTYTFTQAGQYTIGFGVSDARDTSYDSALLIDDISLQQPSASPEAALPESPTPQTPAGDTSTASSTSGKLASSKLSGSSTDSNQNLYQWSINPWTTTGGQDGDSKPGDCCVLATGWKWQDLVDAVLTGW